MNTKFFPIFSSLSGQGHSAKSFLITLIWILFASLLIAGAKTAMADDNQASTGDGAAPIHGLDHPDRIPDQYIVVLKRRAGSPSPSASTIALATTNGFEVESQYRSALSGFVIRAAGAQSSQDKLAVLAKDPQVAYIEADRRVYIDQTASAEALPTDTQSSATWGLDRIDQTDLPLNETYIYAATGAGVNAYVIDSGIRADHQEFGSRVKGGASFVSGGALEDCVGHGTHVAGTIGGTLYGVAKEANLWSVRVFDCSSSAPWSSIISALEWVINNHQAPAVVNMSLSGGIFLSVNEAVENAIAAGITVVVAAGNDWGDACNKSPASTPGAITVGATTLTDSRAYFSNQGSCVDIFAPGEDITSAWHTGQDTAMSLSGTSMASPHTAGVAALYLQQHPDATPGDVNNILMNKATADKLTDTSEASPNLLLYSQLVENEANFSSLYLRRSSNSSAAIPMLLVAANTWEVFINQRDESDLRFRFDRHGDWSETYGDNNGDGIADIYGSDILLPCADDYRITFNDANFHYTLEAQNGCGSDWKRTVVFVHSVTQTGQDLFIRGGINHENARQLGINCTTENKHCALPIRHLNLLNSSTVLLKQGDEHLDWYGPEYHQSANAHGSPLDWTTDVWSADWGPNRTVAVDGFGETPLNHWGAHYWMLDVEMDCSRAIRGWFELKSFIANGEGWEGHITQPGAPYASGNHFAQCGRINVFRYNQNDPVWIGDFSGSTAMI